MKRTTFFFLDTKRFISGVGIVGLVFASGLFFGVQSAFSASSTLFSDGFESGGDLTGWTKTGNWDESGSSAHGGARKAEVKGDTGGTDDDLLKATSTSGYTNITISYWYKIPTSAALESSDHVYLQWSLNGSDWNTVADYTNASTTVWVQATSTLTSGADNSSGFRFRFSAHLNSASGDAFYLDDVNVTGQAITPENTLALCSDTLDNDSDGAIDLADSDCAAFLPQLTVTKIVTNNNGGTAVVGDFPLSIDGFTTTSGVASTTSAGVHTVSETNHEGYTGTISGDCATNGTITLATGDHKACTVTNDDEPAFLIIVKHAIGGDGTFNFAVSGETPASPSVSTEDGFGTSTTIVLNAGTSTVSELLTSGWDFSGVNCLYENESVGVPVAGGEEIHVDNGDTVTCTFTNTKRGSITVHKNVVAPDGETNVSDAHEFTVTLDGDSAHTVSENDAYTYTNLVPDTYTIAENTDSDYDLLGITGGGSVTVGAGENVDVVVTNKQKQGHLTVVKHVSNHGIGTAIPSDFTMSVEGTNVSTASFPGADDEGTAVLLDPGEYSVGESGSVVNDIVYAMSQSGGCSGAITSNGDVTCAITNSDIPLEHGAITVVKHVTNDNGGTADAGDFSLALMPEEDDSFSVVSGEAHFLAPGNYTVSESNPEALGYRETELSCTNGETTTNDGSVELGEQEAWVCTITNDDISPSLTLVKQVINDNGGTAVASDWTVAATDGDEEVVLLGAGGAESASDFEAGTFMLSESEGPEGYAAGDWSCVKNGSEPYTLEGGIALTVGDVATCTITNDDMPARLTIVKHTDSGSQDASFNFSVTGLGGLISLTTDNNSATTSEPILLNAGSYDVLETIAGGWHLAGVGCVYDNESIGETIQQGEHITVGNGDDVTCTFTNTKRGTLVVKKVVINDSGGTATADDFTFRVNEGDPILFAQGENELRGENHLVVDAGIYTVTEPEVAGYTTSYDEGCSGVSLLAGGEIVCTITNDDVPPPPIETPTEPHQSSGGGGGGGVITGLLGATNGNNATGGQVLGASTTNTCFVFLKNMHRGSRGDDVLKLQRALNTNASTTISGSGAGSPGQESDFFGLLTHAAVVRFQELYATDILAPLGLSSGTGFVGPYTRAKLNALCLIPL